MAPLSHELAGLIHPYDHFGSHLDDQGKTVDLELEKQNFEHAGKILDEMWSNFVIDKFPVAAIYIQPEENINELQEVDINWYSAHVRESQYLLQIVKCRSPDCCSPFRSGLFKILPQRFLPPPVRVIQTLDDIVVGEKEDAGSFLDLMTRQALNLTPETKFLQVRFIWIICFQRVR